MTKTYRNISIFIFVALTCGWLGVYLNNVTDQPQIEESLGSLIWLVLPLLMTILLRLFAGDGWKDIGFKLNLKGNIKWYIIALLIYPVVTIIVLSIGKLTGWISFSSFNAKVYFIGFASVLGFNLIKNFFEESVWRGYLTAKLLTTKLNDIWLYLIVGLVWALWHLPYYLYFLPHEMMMEVFPASRLTWAILSIFIMIGWSVMYVEIYRLTKSIWPCVLLHMVEDSVINHLVIDGHITITSGKEIWISPILGIITTLLYVSVGLRIRLYRIKIKKGI